MKKIILATLIMILSAGSAYSATREEITTRIYDICHEVAELSNTYKLSGVISACINEQRQNITDMVADTYFAYDDFYMDYISNVETVDPELWKNYDLLKELFWDTVTSRLD